MTIFCVAVIAAGDVSGGSGDLVVFVVVGGGADVVVVVVVPVLAAIVGRNTILEKQTFAYLF